MRKKIHGRFFDAFHYYLNVCSPCVRGVGAVKLCLRCTYPQAARHYKRLSPVRFSIACAYRKPFTLRRYRRKSPQEPPTAGVCRATALKIFLAVAFLLCEILFKISHIFSSGRVNASGRVDKNRGKIETVRPFEPRRGSTLVE